MVYDAASLSQQYKKMKQQKHLENLNNSFNDRQLCLIRLKQHGYSKVLL